MPDEADADRTAISRGVQGAAVGNSEAFGYSITITATFGVITVERGSPSVGAIMLFAIAAVLAFSSLDAVLSRGFRQTVEREPQRVLLLGTSLDVLAVGAGVGVAALLADVIHSGAVWPLGSLAASATYVVTQGLELALADRIERGRG